MVFPSNSQENRSKKANYEATEGYILVKSIAKWYTASICPSCNALPCHKNKSSSTGGSTTPSNKTNSKSQIYVGVVLAVLDFVLINVSYSNRILLFLSPFERLTGLFHLHVLLFHLDVLLGQQLRLVLELEDLFFVLLLISSFLDVLKSGQNGSIRPRRAN